jgi:hypothetical protein
MVESVFGYNKLTPSTSVSKAGFVDPSQLRPWTDVAREYTGPIAGGSPEPLFLPLGTAARGAASILPRAAEKIDPSKIREIERIVRSGGTAFPIYTGAQLRAVAESWASKIQRQLSMGQVDVARNIRNVALEAIDRLDRFNALTPAARQELRNIVNRAFGP